MDTTQKVQKNIKDNIGKIQDLLGLFAYDKQHRFIGKIISVECRQRWNWAKICAELPSYSVAPFEFWYVKS